MEIREKIILREIFFHFSFLLIDRKRKSNIREKYVV